MFGRSSTLGWFKATLVGPFGKRNAPEFTGLFRMAWAGTDERSHLQTLHLQIKFPLEKQRKKNTILSRAFSTIRVIGCHMSIMCWPICWYISNSLVNDISPPRVGENIFTALFTLDARRSLKLPDITSFVCSETEPKVASKSICKSLVLRLIPVGWIQSCWEIDHMN